MTGRPRKSTSNPKHWQTMPMADGSYAIRDGLSKRFICRDLRPEDAAFILATVQEAESRAMAALPLLAARPGDPGEPDLDNEQPVTLHTSLGVLRQFRRAFHFHGDPLPGDKA